MIENDRKGTKIDNKALLFHIHIICNGVPSRPVYRYVTKYDDCASLNRLTVWLHSNYSGKMSSKITMPHPYKKWIFSRIYETNTATRLKISSRLDGHQ